MENKKVYVLGGGTFSHVRNHLSIAMPAFGETAKAIFDLSSKRFDKMDVELILTKMADSNSPFVTNEDVSSLIDKLHDDFNTKVIFMNVGLCDYNGEIDNVTSGKYAERLHTTDGNKVMNLVPEQKILKKIRDDRKDIFLVAFKTTCGATVQEQYLAGLNLMKQNSCNLVLANDVKTRVNMIITPEESRYHVTTDRLDALTF